MKNLCLMLLLAALISCSNDPINADFVEIKDNLARFDIENNSDSDIEKISFEINYFDQNEKLLLTDTVSYQISINVDGDESPFLMAHDKTFFVQAIPTDCKKADIRILEANFNNEIE
ncbi:hypothetical protein [Algoriphagus sp.]|uniref:hypothetical protein n=1 Tax=Algoriphagus sp. TaxID=1872435 RepID=UPI0025F1BCD3|nr:hypothetical protein [Algoriphagus sp.]